MATPQPSNAQAIAAVDPASRVMIAEQWQNHYQHWQAQPDLNNLSAALQPIANAAALLEWTALLQLVQLLADNVAIFVDDPEALSDDGSQLLGQALLLLSGYCRQPDDAACQNALLTVFASPEWPYCLDDDSAAELAIGLQQVCPAITQASERQIACEADVALALASDVDPKLLAMVLDELPPLTEQLAVTLNRYQHRPEPEQLRTAQRQAHTLKGLAAMVGCQGIVNLTHHLEDVFESLDKNGLTPDAELLACLLQSADSLAAWAEAMVSQQAAPVGSIAVLQQVLDQAYRLQNGGLPESGDTGDRPPLPETPESAPAAKPTPSQPDAASDVTFVRVPLPLLDELLRLVGEQHGLLAQLRAQNQQLKTLLQGHRRHYQQQLRLLAELEHSLANPQQQIADIDTDTGEFDSLEMQQFADWQSLLPQLYETVADSFQTEKTALALARQSHNSLADFSQWHQATLQTVLDSRLVAADSLAARWQRSVRQAERLSGKHAELHLLGADTLLDNQLLAQLTDPLMHLLRNAIDHGLETPEQRLAAGKPERGQITLSFHHEHHQLTVTCQDDGQGIDRAAVRHSAISKGLLDEGTVLSDSEIDRLILLPGFSTRSTATELSGRGIGMDVVNQDISRLQGALDIHSQPGQGCCFTLILPSSALLVKVLLVACGGETVALSGYGIRQVLMVNAAETDRFRHEDHQYPLYRLENLWQKPLLPATKRARAGVMLVQLSTDEQVAVQVTTIVGHREVVLKSLSPYLPTIPGLTGAITLSNGAVAPVLDLPALIRHQRLTGKLNPHALSSSAPKPPLILVVDDSLSARQTTADTLRDSGFQVITAVDGVDALKQLQHNRPDVLVTDLEMPRMNGLELAALLKNQVDTENLPILMISSRSSDKHRQQALAVGIDAYLPKPWSEAELLQRVNLLMTAKKTL